MLHKSSDSSYVTMNTTVMLTVDVSADPEPVATWQFDGGDVAAVNITTLM